MDTDTYVEITLIVNIRNFLNYGESFETIHTGNHSSTHMLNARYN